MTAFKPVARIVEPVERLLGVVRASSPSGVSWWFRPPVTPSWHHNQAHRGVPSMLLKLLSLKVDVEDDYCDSAEVLLPSKNSVAAELLWLHIQKGLSMT